MALKESPRRVVLIGNYGSVNLGDELLLRIVAGWVHEAGGDVVAVSAHPEHTKRVHGIDAVHYADPAAIVRAMADADLMVMGGGGLLQDYDTLDEDELLRFPAFGATQYAQYAVLAATLGVPFVALAQGLGPLRSDSSRRIARHVFGSAIAASLRDDGSAALLRASGCDRDLPVAPDPVWAWRPSHPEPLPPERVDAALAGCPVLALQLRDWPYDPEWEDRFVVAFRSALPERWGCLWIDFHCDPNATAGKARSAIADRLRARLPGVHAVWQGTDLEEAYALTASCDAVLAMRLHGALLAHIAGRPTAVLEYDAKVAAMASELGMPAVQRVPLDALPERLAPAIEAICETRGEPAFRVGPAEVARRAERTLLHRSMLWWAMAGVPAGRQERHARRRWLAEWAHDGVPAVAFVDALEARLHRMLDRQHWAAEERERLAVSLADEREQSAASLAKEREGFAAALAEQRERHAVALADEMRLRGAAQAEASRWHAMHARIEQSSSYRMTAPLRHLAAAWRSVRDRVTGGSAR